MPKKKPNKKSSKRTCALISLGCPKNLVDSERMLGLLRLDGYRVVDEPAGADLVVINTCGFLDTARQESMEAIRQMARLKKRGRLGGIIVAGCLAERDREGLLAACPEIDQIVGVFARDEIATAAARVVQLADIKPMLPAERTLVRPAPESPLEDTGRFRVTPRHLAYLKIAEGCDRLCAFCSIPSMRGKYSSKSIERVVDEAQQLAADGVRELVLIAQDTSSYGRDLYGEPRLAELMARLAGVRSLEWIRPMYLYPKHLGDDLLDVMASSPKILPYMDLPLQHINDEVLRRMRRQVGRDETEKLLDRLRERIPGLILRTTLIAGFPGETDAQFDELLEFVQRRRFERLGVFPYRLEPGTASAELDGHLSEEVRQERCERLMAAQQEIAFEWNQAQVGRQWEVLIDSYIPDEENAYLGRTPADAPDIDGVVYVTGQDEKILPGQFVPCEIVASQGYDLIGVAVGPPR